MKNLYAQNISPLRYPGSKQRIVGYLEHILAHNSIVPEIIVEPFVGGGSVFLTFLLHGLTDKALIADKDRLIYCFWKTVLNDPHHLIRFVRNVKVTVENYFRYKAVAKSKERNVRILAEACLFLNRTSFSGILTADSGPIGGRKQESEYKIDCRFNRELLSEKIDYISSFKKRVELKSYSWKKTINYAKDKYPRPSTVFYYLDPPFFKKGKKLYWEYFELPEHRDLSFFLHSFDANWILSYDRANEIMELYDNQRYKPLHIDVPYTINSRSKRIQKEIIITSMEIPAEI